MWETWLSRTWFPTLMAADDLKIFAALAESPSTAEELGAALGLNVNGVRSVLALLAALGFLRSCSGTYHLTAVARSHVMPDSRLYWGGVFCATRGLDPIAARIRRVLLRGPTHTPASSPGASWGDAWHSGNVTTRRAVDIADFMHSHAVGAAERLAATGAFSGVARLLDVGGGSGCYSMAIARRHPTVECTILDLPEACSAAQRFIAEAGLSDRIDTQPLDMFKSEWPRGHDAILLSNILHDWAQPQLDGLVRNAHGALSAGGKVYVHEALLDDDRSGPKIVAALSVLVMLGTPGGQLTRGELYGLMRGVGFDDLSCSDIPPLYSLVQGRKGAARRCPRGPHSRDNDSH